MTINPLFSAGIASACLLLLSGCAHQPYPPLAEDLALNTRSTYAAPIPGTVTTANSKLQVNPEVATDAANAADSGTNIATVARHDVAKTTVSQKVIPPPPNPETLPSAQTRQLDILLDSQTFNYYEDGELLWSGRISAGTAEHPTPTGNFRVRAKNKNKRSGSYTNSFNMPTPMPYALQFLGPYWVHEGYVPNEPASHGCVRLRYEDAKFVYSRIRVGDPINVSH
ncbi:MAG TPA: murein L,D-transpeptidase [Chromatiaceae bacterium]|jgi:lipoprotein-anchoring transpeptidase ErfK/SrfK|nr:MAG: hypothetical protein N838_21985 [Thiohalocapsa sp. PB-PSB1]QQO52799.1 MAG: L,D-transpeptidase [Thiohalocapsa sp. PB-PSB1]HBG95511.1 murein L,D-transpeptidase [Chromatiaceae bacterium]HCS91410.1 murein L,D-transpeptidase [Chromatiaceae bacterium]